MEPLLWILLIAALLWFGNDSWKSHDRARRIARDACQRAGVQFLDQSVVRVGLGIARGGNGLTLRRHYRFEFATDGSARLPGDLTLIGTRLAGLTMQDPDGSGRIIDAHPTRSNTSGTTPGSGPS